jgi:hypothetical protein
MILNLRNFVQMLLVLVLILTGSNSCKDDYSSTIPYVYVNFTVNPKNIIELNVPGGSIFIPSEGYGGVIIFRDLVDSPNPYLAYDAACTYEGLSMVHVVSDGAGTATCKECKSQYVLFSGDGRPVSGIAGEPLKQYHTYYSGDLIQIKN